MIIETCAKVNLTLEIVSRRDDGFHELATIFQAVDLTDRIRLEPANALRITSTLASLPTDERNLCHRAATRLAARLGRAPEVAIHLDKRIPVGAGLGGGSGNAAGVLGALARLWEADLSDDELVELAAELGSDVAFFLRGGAAVGKGRGEQLAPLPSLRGWRFLILAPRELVSTAAVYHSFSHFRRRPGERTGAMMEALQGGKPIDWRWMVNDLQVPATLVSAAVADDLRRLKALGLARYLLSGSGGAWFVPVTDDESAPTLAKLRAEWPGRDIWTAAPVSYGWREVG